MKTSNTIVCGMLVLALTACNATTSGGLRKRAPVIDADSSRSVEAIGSCLVAASEKLGGQASYVPAPDGAAISVRQQVLLNSIPMLAAAITNKGGQRHVTVWMFKVVWKDNNRHRIEEMQACL